MPIPAGNGRTTRSPIRYHATVLPPRLIRSLTVALAGASVLAGSVMLTLGAFPTLQLTHESVAMAASFIPYGVLAWLVAIGATLALTSGWWRLLLLALMAGLVVQLAWAASYWPRGGQPEVGGSVTVMTVNLYYGRADLGELTDRLAQQRPDILVLQEVTSATAYTIGSEDWRSLLPFRVGEPDDAWFPTNMMLLSRYPLESVVPTSPESPIHVVRAQLPTAVLTIVAVHATNPTVSVQTWRSEIATVTDAVRRYSHTPTIAIGDFNAVREHEPMGHLLSSGMKDAAEVAGVGWLPTYPADSWMPLIAIDHVLVNRRVSAAAVWTWRLPGTDHLGLTARLILVS